MRGEMTLLIGSYTQAEDHIPLACGEGIVSLSLDPETGRLEKESVFKGVLNPSYLTSDDSARQVFAVSENLAGDGEVWHFEVTGSGTLTPLAKQSSFGLATCHVAVLPGDRVAAASYVGGCLAVYPLNAGRLSPAERVFRYQGSGANPLRQEASHAHQTVVSPDKQWFYVCDLGAECIWKHDLHVLEEPVGYPMPAGHGPRHMVFHPSRQQAWVLGELTGAVAVCDWDSATGALEVVATTDVLEEDAAAAAIRVHPRATNTLWISLRKRPSLLVFQFDETGLPVRKAEILFDRGEPRDFAISPDGRWLVSANQSSDELVVVQLDPATGLPSGAPHQHYPLGTPVCVHFLPKTS